MIKKIKFENILIVLIALILIIIMVVITYLNYLSQRANRKALKQPAQNQTQQNSTTPTFIYIPPNFQPEKKPIIEYDPSSQNLLIEKIQNRKPLSESDKAAALKILLDFLPEDAESGTIYTSPNMRIDYNGTLNIFEVEIKTTNISLAKEEAVQWFLNRGFSQDAICNYPLEFILNWDIRNELGDSNIIFSTLAPNCQ